MTIIEGNQYLLHWRKNRAMWNDNLKDLIKANKVVKRNNRYYSIVTAHYSGDYSIVDCTCDDNGDFYPVNTSDLRHI
jgi:hypothetical protein